MTPEKDELGRPVSAVWRAVTGAPDRADDRLRDPGFSALSDRGKAVEYTPLTDGKYGQVTFAHKLGQPPQRVTLINPPCGIQYRVRAADAAKWTASSVSVYLEQYHRWQTGYVTLPSGSATVVVDLNDSRSADANLVSLATASHAAAGTHEPIVQTDVVSVDGVHTQVEYGTAGGSTYLFDIGIHYVISTTLVKTDTLVWQVA
jgi:hypothetical protein